MKQCPVAAVVVQFGPEPPCAACIDSLGKSTGVSVFPVVVDHNPVPSHSLERLVCELAGIYLHDPSNPGFAAGANGGLRAARSLRESEVFLLLNPDVRVATDCLERLCDVLERSPDVGLAGPALFSGSAPGRWWNAGSEISWPSAKPSSLRHGEEVQVLDPSEEATPRDTGFVAGAALAMTRRALDALGNLPEEYFLYFEDAEISFRVRAASLRTVVCWSARAWHSGGGSAAGLEPVLAYYRVRNRLVFSRRWNPHPFRGRLSRGAFALRQTARSLLRWVVSARREALFPALGVLDAYRGRMGKLRASSRRG